MKEIRIHGRGGQGAVTFAELLAVAAFRDGKYSQAFPFFGVERRGAPIMSFTRIDEKFIRLRQNIYNPDYVVVLDPTVMDVVNVKGGLKKNGMIIINTTEKMKGNVKTVDATKIALDTFGRPFVNTPMLGAFVGATKIVKLESVIKTIKERFPGELGEKNAEAVKKGYELVR